MVGYPERQLIYQLGYPNIGNTGFSGTFGPQSPPNYGPIELLPGGYQELDYNVKSTIIRHGNYDYYTRTQIWDPGRGDHTLPNSYYLKAGTKLVRKPGLASD